MKKIITFCSMFLLLSSAVAFALPKYAASTTDPGVVCANCHNDGRTWVPPVTPPPVTPPHVFPAVEPNAVYRFYDSEHNSHFYTASVEERNYILDTLPKLSYEGAVFKTASDESSVSLAPVYRFYNTATGTHFYTISDSEKNYVLAHYHNFIFEGEAYNAYTTNVPGSVGLHRFFNTQTGTHFYTASESERKNVQNNNQQYVYEGIVYYVENATAVDSNVDGGTNTSGNITVDADTALNTTCMNCHGDNQIKVSCSSSEWTGHNGSKVTAAIYEAVSKLLTGEICVATTPNRHKENDANDREND